MSQDISKIGSVVLKYKFQSPSWYDIISSRDNFEESIIPSVYYSKSSDIPKNLSSKDKCLKSSTVKDLKDFVGKYQLDGIANWIMIAKTLESNSIDPVMSNTVQCPKLLTPLYPPPSLQEVMKWIQSKSQKSAKSDELDNQPLDFHATKELLVQENNEFIPGTPDATPSLFSGKFSSHSFKASTPVLSSKKDKSTRILSRAITKNKGECFNKRKKKLIFLAVKQAQDEIKLSGGSEKDMFSDSIYEDIAESTTPTLKLDPEEAQQKHTDNVSLKIQSMEANFREMVCSPSPSRMSFSQNIMGVTLNGSFGFQYASQNLAEANKLNEFQYLTVMCMEVLTAARPRFEPDPSTDPILAVFYMMTFDCPEDDDRPKSVTGAVITSGNISKFATSIDIPVIWVENETELIEEFSKVVDTWDPDIFLGYEVQMKSWGYLLERGTFLGMDLTHRLSRVPENKNSSFNQNLDEYGFANTHQIHICGRIVLNLWRLMKSEVTLTSYTFENVVYHVLHQRIPQYPHETLYKWWNNSLTRWRVIQYYLKRCQFSLMLCERLDLVNKTSELSRLFGIQFYDVLNRGTQFRVESMMLRLTRLSNMVAVSPSIQQRASMNAPEWLSLIMEPESKFYTDPVLVLDFQSLYPSVMIAHNYCFSTCLGKVSSLAEDDQPFKFGTGLLSVPPEELLEMVDQN